MAVDRVDRADDVAASEGIRQKVQLRFEVDMIDTDSSRILSRSSSRNYRQILLQPGSVSKILQGNKSILRTKFHKFWSKNTSCRRLFGNK